MQFNAGRPISEMSQEALGYGPFIKSLAKAIASNDTKEGIVIALDAPWGSGKTSVVNLLKEELGRIEPTLKERAVVFEPWMLTGRADLVAHLFKGIAPLISQSSTDEARHLVDRMMTAIVKQGPRIISGAAATAEFLGMSAAAAAAKALKGLVQPPESASIQDLRDALVKELKERSSRIVVIIDDIDRLETDEIKQILMMLKSVADLPNITYILPVDIDLIGQRLSADYAGSAKAFLEKIVQVRLTLPKPSQSGLENMLFEKLSKLSAIQDKASLSELRKTSTLVCEAFISVPRSIATIENALGISWLALEEQTLLEDLLIVEALRIFDVASHTALWQRAAALTAPDRHARGEAQEQFIDSLEDGLSRRSAPLVRRLFEEREAVKREIKPTQFPASHVDGLPIYFRWSHADGSATLAELTDFANRLGDDDRLSNFFDELLNDKDSTRLPRIIRAFGEQRVDVDIPAHRAITRLISVATGERFKKQLGSRAWAAVEAYLIGHTPEVRHSLIKDSLIDPRTSTPLCLELARLFNNLREGDKPAAMPDDASSPYTILIDERLANTSEDLSPLADALGQALAKNHSMDLVRLISARTKTNKATRATKDEIHALSLGFVTNGDSASATEHERQLATEVPAIIDDAVAEANTSERGSDPWFMAAMQINHKKMELD